MKRLMIIATCLTLALLLAACGGGGSGPQATNLTFEGTDAFTFNPASATVTSGAQVNATFNNVGVLEHTWTLVAPGTNPLTATEADRIAGSGVVAAGGSNTFSFTAPSAGTYPFVCTIPGHAAGGMVGTLTINP
jgi:plastocyanin